MNITLTLPNSHKIVCYLHLFKVKETDQGLNKENIRNATQISRQNISKKSKYIINTKKMYKKCI